jgi:hypothetical protein
MTLHLGNKLNELHPILHSLFDRTLLRESINELNFLSFLGAFAKLRLATIGFSKCVPLSVYPRETRFQLDGFDEMCFFKIYCLGMNISLG